LDPLEPSLQDRLHALLEALLSDQLRARPKSIPDARNRRGNVVCQVSENETSKRVTRKLRVEAVIALAVALRVAVLGIALLVATNLVSKVVLPRTLARAFQSELLA